MDEPFLNKIEKNITVICYIILLTRCNSCMPPKKLKIVRKFKNKKPQAISLFSGMGGDSLGLVQAGYNLVAYCEKEAVFRETHDMNFQECVCLGEKVGGDITKIPDEEFLAYRGKIDMIFAGFPCQGHSKGGKKDAKDPRNQLFFQFSRAVELIQPKYFIGENVKGILSSKTADGSRLFIDVIVEEFQRIGYSLKYQLFKTEKYGVPQKRERVIFIGMRTADLAKEGGMDRLRFPAETPGSPHLMDIIRFDMRGAIQVDPEDFDMTTLPAECILTDMTNIETENPDYPAHPYLRLKTKTRGESYNGTVYDTMLSFGKRASPIHCEIVDIRLPSKTIICTYDHQPRLFVPLRNSRGYFIRCMLPDELKQIQGFPADFKLSGNLKQQIVQIGNSVPPGLICQVAKTLGMFV
jgi:DNA (cytosine-5)-methyltransferase 1